MLLLTGDNKSCKERAYHAGMDVLNAKFLGSDHYGWHTLQQCRGKVGGTLHCRRNEQKQPGGITLRLKTGPHLAATTHCLCGQAKSGDHCHSSSMY